MREDAVYLRHNTESIELVEQYLAGGEGDVDEDRW